MICFWEKVSRLLSVATPIAVSVQSRWPLTFLDKLVPGDRCRRLQFLRREPSASLSLSIRYYTVPFSLGLAGPLITSQSTHLLLLTVCVSRCRLPFYTRKGNEKNDKEKFIRRPISLKHLIRFYYIRVPLSIERNISKVEWNWWKCDHYLAKL